MQEPPLLTNHREKLRRSAEIANKVRRCIQCGVALGVTCLRCIEAHGQLSPDGKRCEYCAERMRISRDVDL